MRSLIFSLLLAPTPLIAHSFYPIACCSGDDCREIPQSDMQATPEGWLYIPSGDVIPYDRVRRTPEDQGGTWHVCTIGGDPAGRVIGTTYHDGACLWAPDMGG